MLRREKSVTEELFVELWRKMIFFNDTFKWDFEEVMLDFLALIMVSLSIIINRHF